MVTVEERRTLRWVGPMPIWARPGPAGTRVGDLATAGQPAILRFDHDEFMQEFLSVVNQDPARLDEWLAQPETWREPMPRPAAPATASHETSPIRFLIGETWRKARSQRLSREPAPRGLNLELIKRQAVAPRTAMVERSNLKLFQSTHKRHYLVSASLIREEAGLPDFTPDVVRREQTGFVVRRLLPPDAAGDASGTAPGDDWEEYAFVPGAQSNQWLRVGKHGVSAQRAVTGEETLPLFPVSFEDECANPRRIFGGVIPVNRREQWLGATIAGDAELGPASSSNDTAPARPMAAMLFQVDVVAPWKNLLAQAFNHGNQRARAQAGLASSNFDVDAAAVNLDAQRQLRSVRDAIQTGSWYVLLDFARFLAAELPGVWSTVIGEASIEASSGDEKRLIQVLTETRIDASLGLALAPLPVLVIGEGAKAEEPAAFTTANVKTTLAEALVGAHQSAQGLEAVETTFTRFDEDGNELVIDDDWPRFLFPLADPVHAGPIPTLDGAPLSRSGVANAADTPALDALASAEAEVDALAVLLESLLPAGVNQVTDEEAAPDTREAWFTLRCVYSRDHCGPLFPPLVSAPSRDFRMAPFFDPDAPSRPVRIPMPVDITPAGLRKFQRNTGFVISDLLCGQLKRIRKLSLGDLVLSVLPWPFHKDLPDPGASGPCKDGDDAAFGMVCSLSIPIVTLCALIVLIIIVALFDMFFRWIPYLFVCLPIPGLKGKR